MYHDPQAESPLAAFALSQLADPVTLANTAIGVFRSVKAPTYNDGFTSQLAGPEETEAALAAPLQLSALLRPAAPTFAGHEDFSFAPARGGDGSEEADERNSGDAGRLVADKLPAVTDAQGAAAVAVKSLPPLTGPSDLLAELSFTDPNGEVQTVAQRVRLWPAAVVAGLSVPRWAGSRGQARFTAVVLDTCLLYTSPTPRDRTRSRMPSSA